MDDSADFGEFLLVYVANAAAMTYSQALQKAQLGKADKEVLTVFRQVLVHFIALMNPLQSI